MAGTVPFYPDGAVILAPLSGYTDLPYRRSMRRHGCRYAFTEMIDVASIVHAPGRTAPMLRRGDDEEFLGVQLVGSHPDWLKVAIDHLNLHHFDVLDFNLGCPVAKVAKKGAGAALGRRVDEALKLFSLFGRRSRFPVSAKIRILSEDDPAPTLELVRGLHELGAVAVTVHGRVKEAFYGGPVHYEIIRAAAEAVPVQIVGNGGVMGLDSCREMQKRSGCAAVMAARGAMGNPWLFRELVAGAAYCPPTAAELGAEIETHIGEMCALYGEAAAMRMARKMVHDYLRGRGFAGEFRAGASHLTRFSELQTMLRDERFLHSTPLLTPVRRLTR